MQETELDFNNARVEEIPPEVQQSSATLSSLVLRCNKISKIDSLLHSPDSQSSFPNLNYLDLYENRLVEASLFLDFAPSQPRRASDASIMPSDCTSDHEDCAHEHTNLHHHDSALEANQVTKPGLLPPSLTYLDLSFNELRRCNRLSCLSHLPKLRCVESIIFL